MGEFLILFWETAFKGFWNFVGCWILISIPFTFLFKLINRILRHWNIRKHGYPPEHCDSDGDLVTFEEEETEE